MSIVVAVADHSGGGNSFHWLFLSQCGKSIFAVIVVAANVAGLFCDNQFGLKLFEDAGF